LSALFPYNSIFLLRFDMLCAMPCPYKLLLLLLWFLLPLFVDLMFWEVSTLVVLVESAQMMQPAVSMSISVRLPRAFLRLEMLSVWL